MTQTAKKVINITHLYENTQNLIKWLEQSNEAVKKLNNEFYEYDIDNSKDCE